MAKEKKKRGKLKLKLFAILILVLLIVFIIKFGFNFGQAGNWLISQVEQISVQPEKETPKDNEKVPSTSKEPEKVVEKAFVPMSFKNYQLYLDNKECPTSQDLTNAILDLKRKHSGKKVYIEYRAKSDDPYKKSVEVREVLEEHGFLITTDKDEVK